MSDAIDELVDWQLSHREPADYIVTVCRACLSRWTGSSPAICPRCRTEQ